MGIALASLSAVGYAITMLMTRGAKNMPSAVVTGVQGMLGPVILFTALQTIDMPWHEPMFLLFLLTNVVLLTPVVWIATAAVQRTDISVIKPIYALSSISSLAFGSLFLGRVFAVGQVTGILIITAGLLSLYHGRSAIWKRREPWIILCAALYYGMTASVAGKTLEIFPHPVIISAVSQTGFLLPIFTLKHRKTKPMQWTLPATAFLAMLSLMSFGQDVLTVFAFQFAPVPLVIAIKRSSILLTAVGGYVLFHEREFSFARMVTSCSVVCIGIAVLLLT